MIAITQHTVTINATPAAVWNILTRVPEWPQWDDGVEWAKLEGELAVGITGKLKPKGGPTTRFIITRLEPLNGLTDKSSIAWMKLVFDHQIEQKINQVSLTHTVSAEGPFSGLLNVLMGNKFRRELPSAMEKLKNMAEKSL